jgi:mycothiol system anti-sigma-R factor
MECKKAEELITMYIDGELDPETETTLTRHLDVCPACHREFETERQVKDLVSERMRRISAPDDLKAHIRTSLKTVQDPSSWWQRASEVVEWYPRGVAGVLAAMLLVTATTALMIGTSSEPPALVVELVKHHANCAIEISSGQPDVLQDWFTARGVPVAVETSTLEPFDYELLGAHICEMMHRDAAYMVYENDGEEVSICCVKDIPIDFEALDQVDFGSARFYTITYGDRNIVLWQEQETVFAIVGQAASEDLVAMAGSL